MHGSFVPLAILFANPEDFDWLTIGPPSSFASLFGREAAGLRAGASHRAAPNYQPH